jgi:hypothetical protein
MELTQTETLLQNKYFHFPLAMWSRVSSSGIHIKISPHHLTEKKHEIVFFGRFEEDKTIVDRTK